MSDELIVTEKLVWKKCQNCDKDYTHTRAWSKFCSPDCRIEYWNKTHPRVKDIKSTKKLDDKEYTKISKSLNKLGYIIYSHFITGEAGGETIIMNIKKIKISK